MNNKLYNPGQIVTVKFNNTVSSNTYTVYKDLGSTILVNHPLHAECLFECPKSVIDKESANVKDSAERSLDYARKNSEYLDYNTRADLEALSLFFVVRRNLTPRQKNLLSQMCGNIAAISLNNDINEAMTLIKKNEALLDDFNRMWYHNFRGLFSGKFPITSKKQRSAIFNMAGFILAELETPATANRYNK